LPLTAFKVVNQFTNDFPRTKLAIMMRAYMMPPNSQGFVPVPENTWARVKKEHLLKLEALLRYWDLELRQHTESMQRKDANFVNASAAANAAAEFITYVPLTNGPPRKNGDYEFAMLKATLDEYEQITQHLQKQEQLPPAPPPAGAEWINYRGARQNVTREEEEAKKRAEMRPPAGKTERLLAKCIQYDAYGNALDEQDFKCKNGTEASIVEIPWTSWLDCAVGREMDLERALTSAVYTVLHSLHTCTSLVHAPIQFLLNETTKK